MSSSPPTTLGKYQIIREIARSNDIVYEAYDPLMNRRVAVKELAMPGGSTPQQKEDRIKRFLREARAVGSLTHPHIMTVFEVGQEGERYFIAMEYLDGHTLRNEIDTLGFLPPDRAIEVAKSVLKALEYAHQNGVIHRDIKPDNIQLLTDGRIKLTDFGIARLTFEPNLTMDGQVFGTPSYMSPEQVVGKEIDQRSDLFSLGVVLYEMISGQKPFAGDSVVSITYAIMNKEPERLQQANFAVWNVIAKALDKSPAMRFANAHEMIEALDAAEKASMQGNVVIDAPPILQSPNTTIYGQAYPPQGNPYLAPYPQAQPAPPPIIYPYNPYAQTNQPMQPPQGPGMQPGFPTPVFYPPPPRQPLVKPETKQFMSKLLVALAVLGTLATVTIIFIGALSNTMARSRAEQHDTQIVSEIEHMSKDGPVGDRIQRMEERIRQLQSPAQITDAKRRLATLYEEQGKGQMQAGDIAAAESSFKTAIDMSGDDAALYTDLADLYSRQARVENDPLRRQQLWSSAGDNWKAAAERASAADKPKFATAAAMAYYEDARELIAAGADRSTIQSVLYDARELAPPNSDIFRQIDQLQNQI